MSSGNSTGSAAACITWSRGRAPAECRMTVRQANWCECSGCKSRLIEFGRFASVDRKHRGRGKPETFDYLGITHFCGKTRNGRFRLGGKPSRKRMRLTLRRIKDELRKRMHLGRHEVVRWLERVTNGWLNYFAVPGTSSTLKAFLVAVKRLLLRTLRKRSQKDRTDWSAIGRLAVTTQGRSLVR